MAQAAALRFPATVEPRAVGPWREDLRFFLRCYAWGFAFFLAFLG